MESTELHGAMGAMLCLWDIPLYTTHPDSCQILAVQAFGSTSHADLVKNTLSDLLYPTPEFTHLQTGLFFALCEELASAYSIQYRYRPSYLMNTNKPP